MRYLSVTSGIEAASVAWEPLGFTPVAFSEIARFPAAVLAHRFPRVPNLGDMTRFEEWNLEPGSIDILVGGTPCQSFSIAGLRGGLGDNRGNLALTYCGILQRFKPKWFVWENVPGCLSSWTDAAEGPTEETDDTLDIWQSSDFATILSAFRECGYSVAARILDAQYFGVPQRRRRIFVVGHSGNWRRAAAVLFEPGCLRGDSAASRKTKSAVAALTANGVGTCGADDNQCQAGHLIAHSLRADGFDASEDGTGRGTPLVVSAYQQHGSDVGRMGCLRKGNGDVQSGVPFIASPLTGTPYADNASHESRLIATSTSDIAHCLNAGGMGRQDYETETMVVAFSARDRGDDGRGYDRPPNVTGEITETVDSTKPPRVAGPAIGVRRLTPRECERLQGFPDDWTRIPQRTCKSRHITKTRTADRWQENPDGTWTLFAADGPRYKSIGNSMAVPVMRWIGRRLQAASCELRGNRR